ncbi:kinase-like domain-containing protein [Lyophyllum atratum]|nr:kinase-like domain-containing protein [Lyophyllum atratum]
MSERSAPPSPNRAVVALVQAEHEWQPVFHASNQVVLYNPRSHALSIRRANNDPERARGSCPYCKQTLPRGFEPEPEIEDIDAVDSDPAYHSRASDYFQLLAIANETSSRPSTPPPSSQDQRSTFPAEKMAEGYFNTFFQEEYKLGMGANGSVFLCQHMLDGNPLGHFAVKKIAVGESHSYLLNILREVRLLERLHHPNIITYHHAWLESCQFSSFGPKIPTLHVLMQWAEGGSLDDFIDVRLGRTAQHIHIDPLAQFSFGQTTSRISEADLASPAVQKPPSGDLHSRSARIRAFRQFQGATPDERERIRREMEGVRAKGQTWKAVHLLSADEVKSLFEDVVSGLEFLHNKSILHLDLKPGNVLLTWDEGKLIPRAMLSDFGTSRDMVQNSRNRSGNTGTLEYASPESLPSPLTGLLQQIDSKADMWSLGMILHKLLFFRLPYRYASDGDANGEPVSAYKERDKLDQLEKEVVSYPGFKSTPGLVTAFEARRLPRSFLVLLESLLNVAPSGRPSCERVASAIKEGKTSAASSLVPANLRPSGHVGFDPYGQAQYLGHAHETENQKRTSQREASGEKDDEHGDGQTTPRVASTPLVSGSGLHPDEKIQLLGPPSPPPPLALTGEALTILARRSVEPLVLVPRKMWRRAFRSCVLVAKVSSIASMCPGVGGLRTGVVFVLLFAAVLDTVVERVWVSVLLGVFHVGVAVGCPLSVCCK